ILLKMKFSGKFLSFAAVASILLAAASCNKSETPATPAMPRGENEGLAIRYVDEDSLMAKYNLAKDFNESMLKRQNQLDAAERQRGAEINKLAQTIQSNYKNNKYLTEESFNADQAKLQKMQADAQNYLAKMQQDIQNEAIQNSKQLTDSVQGFIKQYAADNHFDLILRKAAAFYIDPKYDITDVVVEGLNKRYTKVAKKEN
ncbi:MAG: OmpH family outer membrane protein, partial [Muribaculaceae bacterium]|nr:OmpH family outer membrane protein [Muribaculaceae bacterium]